MRASAHPARRSEWFRLAGAFSACLAWLSPPINSSATEAASSNLLARLAPAAPCPALVAEARARHIPLDRIDPPGKTNTLAPGDSITALVTLFQKSSRRTQWLLYFQVTDPTPQEQLSKPPSNLLLYSSLGTKLEFEPTPAWVTLQTLGPFAEAHIGPAKVDIKTAHFSLNEGFLGLGMDRAAAAMMRLLQTKVHGTYGLGNKPFSEAEIAKNQGWARATAFTPQEERAVAGTFPALMSYFEVAQKTPGLQEILFKLVDLPSIWSMARHGGISPNLEFDSEHICEASPETWGFDPALRAYELPIRVSLNRQPALRLTLVAASPHPPLLACAGVVELLAENPKDQALYMTLRIISGRCAGNRTDRSDPTDQSDSDRPSAITSRVGATAPKL